MKLCYSFDSFLIQMKLEGERDVFRWCVLRFIWLCSRTTLQTQKRHSRCHWISSSLMPGLLLESKLRHVKHPEVSSRTTPGMISYDAWMHCGSKNVFRRKVHTSWAQSLSLSADNYSVLMKLKANPWLRHWRHTRPFPLLWPKKMIFKLRLRLATFKFNKISLCSENEKGPLFIYIEYIHIHYIYILNICINVCILTLV